MANSFPARARILPHFSEPDLIIQYSQASGAFEALEGGKTRVRLSPGDLYVYVNGIKVRTQQVSGQSAANLLPSASIIAEQYSTATYMIQSRAIYDRHDMAAAGNYALSLPTAQDYALEQGIYQQMRSGLLYGFNAANGEGLLNTPGAIAVNLPPDSSGVTTFSGYDNGEMALFLLQQMTNLQIGMYQSGFNLTDRIVIVAPQRIFLTLANQAIIDVVSYQRPGAGTSTVGQAIAEVAGSQGNRVEWFFDDTLIGKGSGGGDMVIMTIPELVTPKGTPYNTNQFGEINPQLKAINLMYSDLPAPIKIPTPVEDGALSILQEIRVTAGWCVRPQGLYLISMPF
ncbi:MAG: DUF2184 domain-containing protein [Ferrovum sp.]|uniref:hypothetical protein n=1 Tax=Ferrovum sp. TaxID=2609467 RepID=UPI002630AB28|nr:hypothetical protein [Ferrovum sp.]MBW8066844.1 DUF2184 domain-containing protein [Ferrovum sp.]